ncbi:TetR-like C-terminal domain-containing protein [Acinetobacter sp. V102_4]|nr:TetR-like C-terminal domain-containing protein [Acinetobacter sp. V102_4]MDS7930104.1 TetR-like C-terminal domain-containing protein [Acinetobacter sp. V102_4]
MNTLNLRMVAELSGTSTQAIYTLLGGKSGLIQAMYQHWITELEQRLLEAKLHSSTVELITQTAHIYREQALSNPDLFLFGCSPAANEANLLEMMASSNAFSLFSGLIASGVDTGLFYAIDNIETCTQALWASIHGAVLFELCYPTTVNLVELNLPILIRGLYKEPPQQEV